jgi:hypothetical protein
VTTFFLHNGAIIKTAVFRCCLLCLVLLLAACSARVDRPVADLADLAQDAGAYHGLAPDAVLVPGEVQRAVWRNFLAGYFGPWDRQAPAHPADDVFWGFARYGRERLFGENTLMRGPEWMERMRAASRVDEYPSMGRRAIAVTDAPMRVMPTAEPAFFDTARAGEGFPFDYIQNSLVLAGTPLFVTHESADREWVLVETHFAFGWVRVRDVAWVDDAFAGAYRTGSYAAVIRDRVPVTDDDGRFLFMGEVGTVLPILPGAEEGGAADGPVFAVPARDDEGRAVLHRARLPVDCAERMPLAATPANFARLANQMLGRPYGWAGLYGHRDCSSLTMNLMTPFGILLPRHSSRQIEAGVEIPLEGLSRLEKKRIILDTATPFLTLVGKPGHVMVYIGQRHGEPVVLHATWGLKTVTKHGYGRKVIGAAVVTTLEPGLERDDLARPEGILLESVYAISALPGPAMTR